MKKTTTKKASLRKLTLSTETLRDLVLGAGFKPTTGPTVTQQVSICRTLCSNAIDGCA